MARADRTRLIASTAALAAVLAACAPSPGKFSGAAEDFLETQEVADWAQQTEFTNASCEDPLEVKVNTTFQCTASGSDGHSYIFQLVIVAERKFRVESLQPQN